MAEIEHDMHADESAEIEVSEEFGHGFYLRFVGNKSAIKIYLEVEQIEQLCKQLKEFGFGEGNAI